MSDYAYLARLLGEPIDALVPVAIQLAHLGRHAQELEIYDKILSADPDHFDGLYLKALRLVKSGEHAACLVFIDRAIAVRPEDGNAHYTKACAHALLGQHEEAIESVRRAIEVAPQLRLFITMDDDFASIADERYLVRFGLEPETVEGLAADAAKAEAHGFPHGVSTRLKSSISGSDKAHRSVSISEVREAFPVTQTEKSASSHIELPKLITREVAEKFNSLFESKE